MDGKNCSKERGLHYMRSVFKDALNKAGKNYFGYNNNKAEREAYYYIGVEQGTKRNSIQLKYVLKSAPKYPAGR